MLPGLATLGAGLVVVRSAGVFGVPVLPYALLVALPVLAVAVARAHPVPWTRRSRLSGARS